MNLTHTFVIALAFLACNNESNENKIDASGVVASSADTSKKKEIIRNYRNSELNAIDSVNKYQVDSLYGLCIEMIYKVYGPEVLNEAVTNRTVSVGESDIRITDFKFKSSTERLLGFDLFWRDSLPVNSDRRSREMGIMMIFFEIDIHNKTVLNATTGYMGIMPFKEFIEIAESPGNKSTLLRYTDEFKDKLHPKFKKALKL